MPGCAEQALLARRQTAGRGRMGRKWASGEGNLHLSVLLRLEAGPLLAPGHWSILAAVAVHEATAQYVPVEGRLRLKWPNDVLLDRGKLAGILLDLADGWLVIGIGVNLAHAPRGLGRAVACLADVAPAPDAEAFARVLLTRLLHWRNRYEAERFAPVRSAWLRAGHRAGEALTAGEGSGRIAGLFHGLGDDGSLVLATADGLRAVISGEVSAGP